MAEVSPPGSWAEEVDGVPTSRGTFISVAKDEILLKQGESVDVPRGAVHRIMNPGDIPVVIVEVQMGDYFGEDDIIRLQDDYDRIK